MVSKKTLLLFAGIVWCLAGFNVTRMGVILYGEYLQLLNVVLSVVVFALFGRMFYKMTKKHTKRICNYEGKQPIYKFFNVQSYCIMAFMMTFGILLRHSGWCPMRFIAVFYTGLGLALFMAGVIFMLNWCRYQEQILEV